MDEEFFNNVSTIQCEMITMNGFHIMGIADIETTLRQRKSTIDEDKTDSTMEQLNQAESIMDENVSGNQSLVNYYLL